MSLNGKKLLGPFFFGALFAIGLGVSGMTEAANIIGFLDIFGHWKIELVFVMGGAVVVYATLYRWILRIPKPLFESSFQVPGKSPLDKRLLLGAALFGTGWGITGLCPGPGLVGLVSGSPHALVFVGTMLIGMFFGHSKFGKNFLSS